MTSTTDASGTTQAADAPEPTDPDALESATSNDSTEAEAPDLSLLEQEGEVAADYLEGLLDIVDLDGDIDMDVEGTRAVVAIVGEKLDDLVGRRGEVLDALQELTRLAVMRQTGERSRLMLDIGGHRERRRAVLIELATSTAADVVASGEPVSMKAMTPFERKVVHDAIAGIDGVHTESEGVEPQRHVVVLPG
ncbi:MAG: spoIIIJ-associated protein [Frankiales bacterium]|nr:spoIIIJ-associated protein [Frankiales bacterium]